MPDIRSFFGSKGGAAPVKPSAAKKVEEEPPKKRTSRYTLVGPPIARTNEGFLREQKSC
jgi:hypothetical protein